MPLGLHCIYLHWPDSHEGIFIFQGHSLSCVFVLVYVCVIFCSVLLLTNECINVFPLNVISAYKNEIPVPIGIH